MGKPVDVLVVLSGCGVNDGAEIHEATLALLAFAQRGARVTIAAPDIMQRRVFDHFKGQEVADEKRSVLAESGRIARGNIKDLATLDAADFDGVFLPGGFGAALNLSDLALAGADIKVEPVLGDFLLKAYKAKKVLGAVCIAPPILAKVLADAGVKGAKLTIGNDPGTAQAIEALGQKHVECKGDSCVVDVEHRVVTAPAYMLAADIAELFKGIDAAVAEFLALIP